MAGTDVSLIAVAGIPSVEAGDDLAAMITTALERSAIVLAPYDVVVVASTIVSKAEDRFFDLGGVDPSPEAIDLAAKTGKDPRLVEVVLRESTEVSRAVPGVLIVRHRLGFVSANAGVDFSNVGRGRETGILLPVDPDASAAALRGRFEAAAGVAPVAVIISDTHGRAFRKGNLNVAIGVSGLPALLDERGKPDRFGRILEATVVPLADEVAVAAALVTGEGDEGIPVVVVRGIDFAPSTEPASALSWPAESDLYA